MTAPELAAEYVMLARRGAMVPWETLPNTFRDPDDAIAAAQELLDDGRYAVIVVQGRGTPEHPTPVGQTEVYRGVGPSWNAKAFFPLLNPDEYDVRPPRPRRKRRR
jgi:hypothetical protein